MTQLELAELIDRASIEQWNTLHLSHNQLTELPESIGKLTKLVKLHLSDNQLTTLPNTITNLINLRYLDLNDNQLTTVPNSIGNLTKLTELYLQNNQLTTLPESIGNLTNLSRIYLNNDMLESEACSLKNSPKILRQLSRKSSSLAHLVAQNYYAPSDLLSELESKYCKGNWVKKIGTYPGYRDWDDEYEIDEFIPSNQYNPHIIKAITANPNTPTSLLWKLGKDFPQALVENPVFNYLEKEFKHHKFESIAGTINSLLQLTPIPEWVLNRVLESTTLRIQLAKHETTPVDYLELLSIDGQALVRASVASCLNVLNMSPISLENLARDRSKEVRINLADNTSTPANCLEILTQDNESEVIWFVARNENTPIHCLEIMLDQNSKNDEIIEGLTLNRSSSADLLLSIYDRCHDSWGVRRNLADNERTPQCLLETLSLDPSESIRQRVATNRNTPKAILSNLIEDIDRNVASNAYLNLYDIRGLH
jgi:hypothetical protein